jgi:polysaccharide biosynthesis/export protein
MSNRSSFFVSVATAICVPTFISAASAAEYRIQAGDVVEITVANAPDMRQRLPVQLDGTISVPLGGTVRAEGSSISEIRNRVRTALATKLIRVRMPDGRDLLRAVEPDEVAAAIVEYKPIFVAGDILRPGEQNFRPRMTVRQAIIAAGGAATSGRVGLGLSDIPSLRTEYIAAWMGVAAEAIKLWRVGQERGDSEPFNPTSLLPSPIPAGMLSELVALEEKTKIRRANDFNRDKDYYRQLIKDVDHQIQVLTEQLRTEEQGAEADEKDLQRALDMYGKGNLPSPRVSEYRRNALLSSTRKLQTTAWLIQAKRTRAESAKLLEKMDDDLQMRLLTEQHDATVKLAIERARFQAANEKLRLAGARPPEAGDDFGKPQFAIIRHGEDGAEKSMVDEDTELQPGDVVQVSVGQVQFQARQ